MKYYCENCDLKLKNYTSWLVHLPSVEHQAKLTDFDQSSRDNCINEEWIGSTGLFIISLVHEQDPNHILQTFGSGATGSQAQPRHGLISNFYYDTDTKKTFIIRFADEGEIGRGGDGNKEKDFEKEVIEGYKSSEAFDWRLKVEKLSDLTIDDWHKLFPLETSTQAPSPNVSAAYASSNVSTGDALSEISTVYASPRWRDDDDDHTEDEDELPINPKTSNKRHTSSDDDTDKAGVSGAKKIILIDLVDSDSDSEMHVNASPLLPVITRVQSLANYIDNTGATSTSSTEPLTPKLVTLVNNLDSAPQYILSPEGSGGVKKSESLTPPFETIATTSAGINLRTVAASSSQQPNILDEVDEILAACNVPLTSISEANKRQLYRIRNIRCLDRHILEALDTILLPQTAFYKVYSYVYQFQVTNADVELTFNNPDNIQQICTGRGIGVLRAKEEAATKALIKIFGKDLFYGLVSRSYSLGYVNKSGNLMVKQEEEEDNPVTINPPKNKVRKEAKAIGVPSTSGSAKPSTSHSAKPSTSKLKLLKKPKRTCRDPSKLIKTKLAEFCDTVSINSVDFEKRQEIIFGLKLILREGFPKCNIRPYGSYATGLSDTNSTLRLAIIFGGDSSGEPNDETTAIQEMGSIYKFLRAKFEPPRSSQMPQVHKLELCGFSFKQNAIVFNDSSRQVNVVLSYTYVDVYLHYAEYLQFLQVFDPRLETLLLFVRTWAKSCHLVKSEHVRTYALELLLIVRLQMAFVLPTLETLKTLASVNASKKIIDGCGNVAFCQELEPVKTTFAKQLRHRKIQSPDHVSTLELAIGFFNFYKDLQYQHLIVSSETGQIIPKPISNYIQPSKKSSDLSPLTIRDPFVVGANAAKHADDAWVAKFKIECSRMAVKLEDFKKNPTGDLMSLLKDRDTSSGSGSHDDLDSGPDPDRDK